MKHTESSYIDAGYKYEKATNADKARAAGCDVELHIVSNAPHVFPLLFPWSAEARSAVEAMTEFAIGERTKAAVAR